MAESDAKRDTAMALSPRATAAIGATCLNGVAWSDGESAPEGTPAYRDRGFVLGDGLFETLAIRDGRPVLWRAHIDRIRATATALHFPLPADFETLAGDALRRLAERAPPAAVRGALRITVTRGSGTAYGLDAPEPPRPTVLIRLTPATPRSTTIGERETAWIVDQPRIDPASALSGHKTTSSMWRVMAHEAARQRGADLALLKTIDGDVGEADTASVFAVVDGVAVTPPLSRGILPSTTRAFALDALRAAGRRHEERQLRPADLYTASEVFLSSSVSGIRPLAAIDGRQLPEASPCCDPLHTGYEALAGDEL